MVFNQKRCNKFLIILLGVLFFVFFISFAVNKRSYAFVDNSNYMGDYILNPKWVEYMDLSEE